MIARHISSLRGVQHINTVFFRPFCKLNGISKINAALAAFGSDNRKFIINRHVGNGFFQCADQQTRKTGAVFKAAAEFIGAVVHVGIDKADCQAVAVNLNHINAGGLCTLCAFRQIYARQTAD